MNMVAIGKLPELLRFHAITRYDVLIRGSAAKEMSLFAEMRRRNVVRVGIAYIVIGWLLAQVAEFAFENFGAPDWVLKTFAVVILLGLPLALFFAWAFEIAPEGVKREKDDDR